MPVGEKQIFRFGPFELDTQCRQLRKDGVGLKVQGQPVQILEVLLEKPRQLVTREDLRERLWASDTFVDFDHSLNTAIKKLRQVLGDEADTPHYIETLPRRGYRFVGELAGANSPHNSSGDGPLAAEDFVRKVATTLADAAINAAADSRRRARRRLWIAATSVALLIIATAAYWITKPLPVPKIVNAHALTKTGFRKTLQARLVTDGVSVYFQEDRPSGMATLQVRISGGEPSEVTVSKIRAGILRDISPDGSSLLLSAINLQTRGWDTWIQPLPTGPARLILKDTRWPLWTPDGKSILFARNNDHDLYRSNADGTDARRLATLPDITTPEISPDGRRLRFAVAPRFDLWEARADGSGAHVILPEYKTTGEGAGSWSPDGKYFFFGQVGGDRSDLWVLPERQWWRRSTTNPIPLTFGPASFGTPVISKDKRQLFSAAHERHGELSVYDQKAGRFVPYLDGIPACYLDFSRDGKWIAYVSYPEGTLWRRRIDGTERRQLTTPPLGVINPRWSPDGKLIAFTDVSNGDRSKASYPTVHQIYVISADGGAPILLLAGGVEDPTWSPDARFVAYAYHSESENAELRILDLESQKSATVPGSHGFWSPRWSPDGKHLVALGMPNLTVGLFNFATQKWETLPTGVVGWPTWSHDSRFVYVENLNEASLVRINVADHSMEQVASLKGFLSTAYRLWSFGWYGLTPDDLPITTRDTGIEEIYAFDLEYK
jgi:Tol biopolymer transport system component/DNA-binding winged helix-turn-helix (wHTH) protein